MNQIKAPFNQEQIDKLNKYQASKEFHVLTCLGKPYIPVKGQAYMCRTKELCENGGLLIADKDGFFCPCHSEACSQDFAWEFMLE